MATKHPATITMRAHSAMERWLISTIENLHGIHVISADATFPDMGLDALETVELVMEAEEEFGIEITDDAAEGCNTPALLAGRIAEILAA